MHSKTLKPTSQPPTLWKTESGCAEVRIESLAKELAQELRPRDRVLLEGPMGVGKSTFARALLLGLGAHQPPEGSPTFAIAHEYTAPRSSIAHLDFYRLKSEAEIEDAGISAYFWERDVIVLAEWVSMHPEFEKAVLRFDPERRNWLVRLDFCSTDGESGQDTGVRNISIKRL